MKLLTHCRSTVGMSVDCLAVLWSSFLTVTYCYLLCSTSTYFALQLRSNAYLLLLTPFNQYLPCSSTPFKHLLTTPYFVQPVLTLSFNSVQRLYLPCYLLRSTSTYLPLQLRSNTTYLLQLRVQRLTYHYWLRSNTTYLLQLRSNSYLPLLTLFKHSLPGSSTPFKYLLTTTYRSLQTRSFRCLVLLTSFKCDLLLLTWPVPLLTWPLTWLQMQLAAGWTSLFARSSKCFRACPKAISAHKCNSKVPLASAKVCTVHCIAWRPPKSRICYQHIEAAITKATGKLWPWSAAQCEANEPSFCPKRRQEPQVQLDRP